MLPRNENAKSCSRGKADVEYRNLFEPYSEGSNVGADNCPPPTRPNTGNTAGTAVRV